MIKLIKSSERGLTEISWLHSRHSFSFGNYYNPNMLGFSSLRVINEDQVAGGQGFLPHSHKDMEIITYVLSGELRHQDSLGNGEVLKSSDVQVMTAGSGIKHSEFNNNERQICHFYQIWITPKELGLKPNYSQKNYPLSERFNQLKLIASEAGKEDSLIINQDAEIYLLALEKQQTFTVPLNKVRSYWLQVVSGKFSVGDLELEAGDALAGNEEEKIIFSSQQELSELMLFNLA